MNRAKMGDWSFPKEVHTIFNTLGENGYEAYLVGGCVRDLLMGLTPSDWDFASEAEPKEVMRIFQHTVPTGVKHGTVTVLLNAVPFEVTTYRTDSCYIDGRRPESVSFVKSIKEDLSRRDFTINAMAYHPKKGLLDLFGGQEDIGERCIRTVGEPMLRFSEDALRMLRAIRFSCRFDFSLQKDTLSAISKMASDIIKISKERIQHELSGMLLSSYPQKMTLLFETGLLKALYPSLSLKEREIPFEKIGSLPKELDTRLAAFLLPLGEDGADAFLKAFRYDRKTTESVKLLLKMLSLPFPKTSYEVRKLLSKMGTAMFPKWLSFEEVILEEDCSKIRSFYQEAVLKHWPLYLKDLRVNGNDLKQTTVPERAFSDALNFLLDMVLKDPERNTKEELLRALKQEFLSK